MKQKRFYIGTNSDYQLARQYIQTGKGCSVSCNRGRGVVPQPTWSVAQEQHWDKSTQLSSAQLEQMVQNSIRALSWLQVCCSNDASHNPALT